MSQPSSGVASSSSDQIYLDLIINQLVDKIGQLQKYLKAQSQKETTKTEQDNASSGANSGGVFRCRCWKAVVCCRKTPAPQTNSPPVDPSLELLHTELKKAETDLKIMPRAFLKLKKMDVKVIDLENLKQWFDIQTEKMSPSDVRDANSEEILKEVRPLNETLGNLRTRIVSLMRTSNSHNGDAQESDTNKKFEDYFLVGENKGRYMKEEIRESLTFKSLCEDFLGVFETLNRKTKLCLLCFSALPEDAVVKKRALLHWWIGEGFIGSDVKDEAHVEASKVLKNLVTKGFIQPDLRKRRLVGFKMDRLVRAVAVEIAEKLRFLSFDGMGVPEEDFSWSHRVCLVERGKESSRQRLMKRDDQEKLHTIFNVNDHYPDFKKLWFSKLKNLNVLCLGGWQGLERPHIEVEGTEFLDDLKIMKYLKLLSFQGISRITKLPKSVCELDSLLILDLKACHNLEELPKNLKALKNLTHLDMSECYMLDHIPQGLGSLEQLRVLKGFLVGDPASKKVQCRLEDLAQLKLRKLSISTAREDFPTEDEVRALKSLDVLENLTLTWRGKPSTAEARKTSETQKSPANLSDAKATRTRGKGKGENQGTGPVKTSESVRRTLVKQLSMQTGTPKATTPASAEQTKCSTNLSDAKATRTEGKGEGRNPGTSPARSSEFAPPGQPEGAENLQKLELQCFPGTAPPKWLMEEGKLKPTKKLYISGGNLQSLCKVDSEVKKWSVKILRLKYLKGLKMDWSELKNSFEELVYLEKVKCPKLTLFPCDEDGLWLKPMQAKDLEKLELGLTWSFLNRRPVNMQISPNKEKSEPQNGK